MPPSLTNKESKDIPVQLDLPEDLWRMAKAEAARRGVYLRDFVAESLALNLGIEVPARARVTNEPAA